MGRPAYASAHTPRRNTRFRARAEGVVSPAVEVYTELPVRVRRRGPGGPRPWLLVRVASPDLHGRAVYGYLARAGRPWRRVAAARLRRDAATLRYPRHRLAKGDRWLVCVREARPDAYGRPRPLDRLCGRPTLRR